VEKVWLRRGGNPKIGAVVESHPSAKNALGPRSFNLKS
jgi:hypothetical protein